MWNLKGIEINKLYNVKHFVEKTSYCEVYSASEIATSAMVNLSIYKKSEIADDDLDNDGNLREIQFLEIGIDAFPKLKTFGDFKYENIDYSYIATEFIVGESVSDRIKRLGPLDEYDTVKIALKLCEVGEKLHNRSKPVLINGLSLDNIMIDMSKSEEQIKFRNLINMRLMNDDFKYNYLDGLSVNQVAPEVFENNFSPKSDQFNVGALVYQIHTGSCPLFSDESINLKHPDAKDGFLEFRNDGYSLSNNVSVELRAVIQKSLSKDPNERYDSLFELSRYLNKERIIESGGTQDNSNIEFNTGENKSDPLINRGNGFADIAGMDELKNKLKSKIIDVIKRPEHFKKYGVTIPNGMLLYGPPGCGKTFISEKFCEEAGFNFFLVKTSDVTSTYKSGGEQKIGQLFKDAAANAPTVICFDEVDGIMPKRQSGESSQHKNSEVNEFLNAIDVDLTGLSGAEGWNLPSFNATCLGKWSIVLNATSHKDWATKENSILIEPNGEVDCADNVFFKKGSPFNQGTFYSWDEDQVLAAMEESEKKVGHTNTEGQKLADKLTYSNTVDVIMSRISNDF